MSTIKQDPPILIEIAKFTSRLREIGCRVNELVLDGATFDLINETLRPKIKFMEIFDDSTGTAGFRMQFEADTPGGRIVIARAA